MPIVGKGTSARRFPYTPAGIAAAEKARAKAPKITRGPQGPKLAASKSRGKRRPIKLGPPVTKKG